MTIAAVAISEVCYSALCVFEVTQDSDQLKKETTASVPQCQELGLNSPKTHAHDNLRLFYIIYIFEQVSVMIAFRFYSFFFKFTNILAVWSELQS